MKTVTGEADARVFKKVGADYGYLYYWCDSRGSSSPCRQKHH